QRDRDVDGRPPPGVGGQRNGAAVHAGRQPARVRPDGQIAGRAGRDGAAARYRPQPRRVAGEAVGQVQVAGAGQDDRRRSQLTRGREEPQGFRRDGGRGRVQGEVLRHDLVRLVEDGRGGGGDVVLVARLDRVRAQQRAG